MKKESNVKHTLGPWKVISETNIYGNDGLPVADATLAYDPERMYKGKRTKGMSFANARLIAAAPDLLDSVKKLLNLLRNGDDGEGEGAEIVMQADARVRKAEGD